MHTDIISIYRQVRRSNGRREVRRYKMGRNHGRAEERKTKKIGRDLINTTRPNLERGDYDESNEGDRRQRRHMHRHVQPERMTTTSYDQRVGTYLGSDGVILTML